MFDYITLRDRIRQLAFLNKGLNIIIEDHRDEFRRESFLYNGGIIEYVKYLNKGKEPINEEIIYVTGEKTVKTLNSTDSVHIEIALQYTKDYNNKIYTFTNNIYNENGGTHEAGFRNALTKTINKFAKAKSMLKKMKL